ncbi:Mitochondrial 2-oxodicarboxylate carrier, partial [Ophiophagus hannah]
MQPPDPVTFAVAGLGSGLTEAVVVNPFEVVKVSLQANRDAFKEQPSTFAKAHQIIQANGWGLSGLNKGLSATLGRHGVFNMVYFGFYFNVKNIIPANKLLRIEEHTKYGILLYEAALRIFLYMVPCSYYGLQLSSAPTNIGNDPTLEFLRKFGIGLASGTIASIINIPFDVAKSRIQGPQPVPGEIKYRTCFKTMATVYKEEG